MIAGFGCGGVIAQVGHAPDGKGRALDVPPEKKSGYRFEAATHGQRCPV